MQGTGQPEDALPVRCEATLELKRGTVLYIPHTIKCSACHAEIWLETGAAPDVEESLRRAAIETSTTQQPAGNLGGRPLQTWSPASSDWRDRSSPKPGP